MTGWRAWLAFELRPGVTRASVRDLSGHWRGLRKSCRGDDGKFDAAEYTRWLDLIVEHSHLLGDA